MNSVRLNNLSLKYQRFITSGFKDIEVWIFEFVTKTQFLFVWSKLNEIFFLPNLNIFKWLHIFAKVLLRLMFYSCFVNKTWHSFLLMATGNFITVSFSRQKKSFNVSVDITCQTTSVFIFFYLENYHFSVIDDCTIKKKKFAESSYACSSLSCVYRISWRSYSLIINELDIL